MHPITVVLSANIRMVLSVFVGGNTVVGEQGVEDGAEDTSLWSASVCDNAG